MKKMGTVGSLSPAIVLPRVQVAATGAPTLQRNSYRMRGRGGLPNLEKWSG